MSEKLMIEQLSEGLEMEKKAEEAEMEKIADIVNVVDQAQTLSSIGEDMFKIASALEDESLAALAVDTYDLGQRMGSCLVKTASEDSDKITDSLEIAEDMHKLASVYADLADETGDETLVKMAEAMIPIANEMTEEANNFYEELQKEAAIDPAEGTADAIKIKSPKLAQVKHFLKKNFGPKAFTEDVKQFMGKAEGTTAQKLKALLSTKEGMSALKRPAVAGGAAIAALAGLGYGAKKALSKKDR